MRFSTLAAIALAALSGQAPAATLNTTGVSNTALSQTGYSYGLEARDFNRDGKVDGFFDREANITWWAKGGANLANWTQAKTWAADLNVFGYDDWRLPTATDHGGDGCNWSLTGGTDCGYNVDISKDTGSELARLYYLNLGNKGYYDKNGRPITDYGLKNVGDFTQLVNGFYWIDLEPASNKDAAWYFNTVGGNQLIFNKQSPMYALAVADGDVGEAVGVVSEPATLFLSSLGLMGIGVIKRKSTIKSLQPCG